MERHPKCVVCETDLPSKSRRDLRYCGVNCRVKAHRARKTVSAMTPPRTRARRRPVRSGAPRTRLEALQEVDALSKRIAGLEEARRELATQLQWAAAEANQRVVAVTQDLAATHKAALDRVRMEAAERERSIQEALISDSKATLDEVRAEATKQHQETAAQVAQLQQKLRQASADLSVAQDMADRAEAALENEREQRRRLADSLIEQRSQVAQLRAAMSSPTPTEIRLRKDLEDAQEKQRLSSQALLAARRAVEQGEAVFREERQRREKLSAQAAEFQTQLATLQKASFGPTAKELQLQKDLADVRGKLLAVNQTREDIEMPLRKRVQELEQQLVAAAEAQKHQQAQSLPAKQEAPNRMREVLRELEQDEQEESDRQGLEDLLKDKIRLLDHLAYLQESLRLPVTGTKLRDNSDVMVSAKASVAARELRLAYFLRSQRLSEDPATWRHQAELMDHDSEQELWMEQAHEVQRLRDEATGLELRKKMKRR